MLKNDEFQGFVETVVNQAVDSEAADMDAFMAEAWAADTSKTVKDALVEKIAVIGENLNIRRFEKVAADRRMRCILHPRRRTYRCSRRG